MYTDDSIIIIRHRDGAFRREDITTESHLMDGDLNAEEKREYTIGRLREDPTVILVLEPRDGRCEETAALPGGYEMAVTITDGDRREATLAVRKGGETIYENSYAWDFDDYECDDIRDLTQDMIEFLSGLDGDREWLYHQGFVKTRSDADAKEEVSLYQAEGLIQDAGYQVEYVDVPFGEGPMLFLVENELVLLGSRRFGERDLFIEVKRLRWAKDGFELEKARCHGEGTGVEVIDWEDGSIGFRSDLSTLTPAGGFLDEVLSRLGAIEDLLSKMGMRGEGPGDFERGIILWRQRFAYEAFDASIKLSKIKY